LSFFELELDLSHEVIGGHDLYRLGYAGGECVLCVDFAHAYQRKAAFLGEDLESTRTFFDAVARDAGLESDAVNLPLRRSPGPVDVLLVGELQDDDGNTWVTARAKFTPTLEIELRLSIERKTCMLSPRLGSVDSVFSAWRGRLFEEPILEETPPEVLPSWVAGAKPLISAIKALPERFTNRVIWVGSSLVGVAEDAGLLFAQNKEGALEIIFETGHISAIAGHGASVYIVHDEDGVGFLSVIPDIHAQEIDVEDLYEEPNALPSDALVVSADGRFVAMAVPGRQEARFATLILSTANDVELDCVEDAWPVSWDGADLVLRGVDGGGALTWNHGTSPGSEERWVGPHQLIVGDGAILLGKQEFESDGASQARLAGRAYQSLDDGWCVFNWMRPYLVHVPSRQGWPLLPADMSAQLVNVNSQRTEVLFTIDGVSFVAKIVSEAAVSEECVVDGFKEDRFFLGDVDAGISLATLGRVEGLTPEDVRVRLNESAQGFVDLRLLQASDAWNNDPAHVGAISVDHAGVWSLLTKRLEQDAWLVGFQPALEATFLSRLGDDKFLDFAVHGGVIPGDHINRVQEALVGARSAWLDPPQTELQQQVALAVDVALEVLGDVRSTPIPTNVWEDVEDHMTRLHHLLAAGVPDVVGLNETIELLRSIEIMATR